VIKNSVIEIQPNHLKFNGNGGCNRIGGNLQIEKNNIKFSNVFQTKMLCENMEQESLFLRLLEMTNEYKITGGKLLLYKNTTSLMTFTCSQ